jgi:microcystin-dependent protein
MSDQYVGEIRIFGFNFAPNGWAMCNGQLLPISQNTALFSLLGTNYGGDGRQAFALPNLQGAAALGQGSGPGLTPYAVGELGGLAAVTLFTQQLPAHTHQVQAFVGRGGSSVTDPAAGDSLAAGQDGDPYTSSATNLTAMAPNAIGAAGGGAAHNNYMPSLVLNYCIALVGIYPPRS